MAWIKTEIFRVSATDVRDITQADLRLKTWCLLSSSSLRLLCVLGVSAVNMRRTIFSTAETQRT